MIEFIVQHENRLYDFSAIVSKLSTSYKLNDGCGKLEFEYLPAGVEAVCGDVVRLKDDGAEIFYGRVFKASGDKSGALKATAYDQLRYCKAKDTISVNNDTLDSLVRRMCGYLGLTAGGLAATKYKLALDVQDSKTWLDMVYGAVSDTLIGTGKKYRLADEFGSVTLKDIEGLYLNLILGDGSLCYDYEYSSTVDNDYYNQVKLVSDNEATGRRDVYMTKDSRAISKYGLLQYFDVLDKNANAAQVKSKADALLSLYNAEVRTLKLKCLGDNRIREGVSFYGQLEDIGLNRRLIVKSARHDYVPVHTMEIEVSV